MKFDRTSAKITVTPERVKLFGTIVLSLDGFRRPLRSTCKSSFALPPPYEGAAGAGIAGLKIARCLIRHGWDVVILEGAHVGAAASSRNQGTIDHSPNLGYRECIELHSRQIARDLWRLGLENQRLIRDLMPPGRVSANWGSWESEFV